jgi:hypothetical protein
MLKNKDTKLFTTSTSRLWRAQYIFKQDFYLQSIENDDPDGHKSSWNVIRKYTFETMGYK